MCLRQSLPRDTAGLPLFLQHCPAPSPTCFRLRIDRKISETAGYEGLAQHRAYRCKGQGIRAFTKGENVMMICSSPRSLLLAGAFISAFTCTAAAQQPANPPTAAAPVAAAPLPPGSPLTWRPDNEAAAKLAPVAPPPLPAAPDKLPLAKLKVPAGFNIEGYAAGMAN